MDNNAYNLKNALPNKVLDENGNTTDLFGNSVTPTSEAYVNKPSLPNKWLNPDGTYSTLTEIIGGAIDTDIFVIVEELPQVGDPKKIYLVPDGEGGFTEYHYKNGNWDIIGSVSIDLSDYWTIEQVQQAIATALQSAKDYADTNFLKTNNTTPYTPTADYHPATKKYVDDNAVTFKPFPNSFVTDSTTQAFLNSITGASLPSGMAYLGQVSLSDMPDGVTVQAEVEVYIYPQNVAYCVMRSAEVAPYVWECNSYEYRGWEEAGGDVPQIYFANMQIPYNQQRTYTSSTYLDVFNEAVKNSQYSMQMIYVTTGYGSNSVPIRILKGSIDTSQNSVTVYTERVFYNEFLNSYTKIDSSRAFELTLNFTNGVITSIVTKASSSITSGLAILMTDSNYSVPYIPLYAGSPATKKYVDDSIATNITNALNGSY